MEMQSKENPICIDCKRTDTLLWTKAEQGQICQECSQKREKKESQDGNNSSTEILEDNKCKANAASKEHSNKNITKKFIAPTTIQTAESASVVKGDKRLRKSTRATRFKAKQNLSGGYNNNGTNGNNEKHIGGSGVNGGGNVITTGNSTKAQSRGRNRRTVFKRTPFKTPASHATTHCVDNLFYKGSYIQVGDIVSLVDREANVYYAQIRGLLVDNYCEKSAFLTWLIPTQESPNPKEGFDAATYLIGPDEELSRKLSCLEFVMHAPSTYYIDRTTPFPLPDEMEFDTKPGGYIWTTLPEIRRNKTTVTTTTAPTTAINVERIRDLKAKRKKGIRFRLKNKSTGSLFGTK